jgi:hypothetical protein
VRIPSGKTDQYIYFVAVDATDLVTRETGLATWTVYRSRKGAAEVAYTTPTITQIDATNMPGVYALLIDEDTTIDSGSDSEEYCVHITHSGMAPVTRTIELYRRDTTSGNTASVDANGRVDVIKVAGTTQTAGDLAALINTVDDFLDTEIAALTTNLATANTNINTIDDFLDTEIAAIKAKTDSLTFTVAGVLDANTLRVGGTVQTAGDLAALITTVDDFLDTEIAAIKAKTDNLPAAPAATGDIPSAATIADAVWDEALAGHAGAGSAGEALSAAGTAGDPWTTALPGAYGAGTAGKIIGDNLNATVSSRASQTSLDTVDDFLDTEIAAIKAKTDNLPASPAATGDIPSAGAIADAVWDEATAGHVTAGSFGKLDQDIAGYLDTEIAAIKAKTDNLPADPADASDIAARFTTVDSTLSTIAGYLDTEIAAIKAKTDTLPASPAATGDIPTAAENADALLDRANGIETGYTPRQALRIMSAVLGGKSSGHPGNPVYRNLSDTADRVTATVSSGNRTAVTLSP